MRWSTATTPQPTRALNEGLLAMTNSNNNHPMMDHSQYRLRRWKEFAGEVVECPCTSPLPTCAMRRVDLQFQEEPRTWPNQLSLQLSHPIVPRSPVHCLDMEENLGQLAKVSSTKNRESSMPRLTDLDLVDVRARAVSPNNDHLLLLCAVVFFGLQTNCHAPVCRNPVLAAEAASSPSHPQKMRDGGVLRCYIVLMPMDHPCQKRH